MSSKLRRYEILLPLRYNDGRPIPRALIGRTLLDLRRRFGALSSETQTIRGQWEHQGNVYQDELTRVFLDVEDSPENQRFFTQFKETLKTRFEQIDIWMTTYPIEAI
jgi:hypothetical protein